MKKIVIIAVIVVLGLGGAAIWYWEAHAVSRTTFQFEEVVRGRLVGTVSSTGTLQAQEVVDVGAQVLGRIVSIGADRHTKSGIVDWGSQVHGPVKDKDGALPFLGAAGLMGSSLGTGSFLAASALVARPSGEIIIRPGTVLAQIDPLLYEAQRNAASASVLSAKATVKSAAADVLVKSAALVLATRDLGRAEILIKPQEGIKGIQQAEYDQFKAAFESAKANLEVSKAMLEVARAQVEVTQANLKNAETNLDYCTISAPVSGKVIDRRVNMGQTVVASLSAPSLFLIAKDLTKMEVWATVNEVDVGRIKNDQDVDYTVDALPGQVYHGKVVRQGKLPFRLNATMTSNVVTYTVVVSVENKDEVLKPYMTANLSFIVEDKENALVVPNSALRWQPTREQIAPEQRDNYFQLKNKKRSPTDPDAQDQGFVWTQGTDGFVRFTQVRTGMSDGVRTEILKVIGGGDLPEHTQVIVGESRPGTRDSANPFSVQMYKSRPKD